MPAICRTVAVEDGDYYVLNGAKNFITHGKSGNVAVVIARTGEVGDSRGMTAFVIDVAHLADGRKEASWAVRRPKPPN